MARRRQDWPRRLSEAIAARQGQPFQWGVNDCALFACSCVAAITGEHPARESVGAYSDRSGAEEHLGPGGLEKFADTVAGLAGFTDIPVLYAQRGDVVLANVPQPSLGVVDLSGRTAVFSAEVGVVRHPLRNCRRAWRI